MRLEIYNTQYTNDFLTYYTERIRSIMSCRVYPYIMMGTHADYIMFENSSASSVIEVNKKIVRFFRILHNTRTYLYDILWHYYSRCLYIMAVTVWRKKLWFVTLIVMMFRSQMWANITTAGRRYIIQHIKYKHIIIRMYNLHCII